jgi:hypothetical protein
MLNPEDRRAIEGLFDRLAEAERRAPDRDRDAEDLIRTEIGRLPSAPYYMAQTIVVQQQGLEAAEARIKELEAQVAQRQRSPWDRAADEGYDPRQRGGFGGGGFLGGAMQTALGVAGGVLLGSAIGSLFGAGAANAADGSASDPGSVGDQDHGGDAGFDSGGDDFGGGDFDIGGDF